jgi:hypothetical protein
MSQESRWMPTSGPTDDQVLIRLQHKLSEPVTVMESFAEGRVPVPVPATGYRFSWGHVTERCSNLMLVWDFYLDELREQFRRRDLSMTALQERVFGRLEALIDNTARDNVVSFAQLAVDVDGWTLIPAPIGRGAAFSVLCHFGFERAGRGWLIGEFIPEILPQIFQEVLDDLDH